MQKVPVCRVLAQLSIIFVTDLAQKKLMNIFKRI